MLKKRKKVNKLLLLQMLNLDPIFKMTFMFIWTNHISKNVIQSTNQNVGNICNISATCVLEFLLSDLRSKKTLK